MKQESSWLPLVFFARAWRLHHQLALGYRFAGAHHPLNHGRLRLEGHRVLQGAFWLWRRGSGLAVS